MVDIVLYFCLLELLLEFFNFFINKEIWIGFIGYCWVYINDLLSYWIKRCGIVLWWIFGIFLLIYFYLFLKLLICVYLNIMDGEGGILLSGYIFNILWGKLK